MKKRFLAAFIIGTMTLALTPYGVFAGEAETDTSDYKTLRVGCGDATEQNLIDLAIVAQKNGYLEEELNKIGYTLEVTGFTGQGPEINAAMMSNSLDAATYGDFPTLTATGSGADIKAVAVLNPSLTYAILASDDSIQEPADLEGKSIVVQQGTMLHYFWEQLVAETGIDESTVEVINANASDAISLLQTGDADAFVSSGYAVGYYAEQGLGHQVEGFDVLTGSTATYFVVNQSVLEEDPEVGVAINKALLRSYDDVLADPEIFYEFEGERFGVESVRNAYGFDSTLSYLSPEITDETISSLNDLYDWMKTNQLIAAEIDVESIFAKEYYQQAVEELAEE